MPRAGSQVYRRFCLSGCEDREKRDRGRKRRENAGIPSEKADDGRKRMGDSGAVSEKHTLCWTCRNAVPGKDRGCEWSRYFQPVPGWTAVKQAYKSKPSDSTYHVQACPEYWEDGDETPVELQKNLQAASALLGKLKRLVKHRKP